MSVDEMVRLWKDPAARLAAGVPHPAGEIALDLVETRGDTWTMFSTPSVTSGRHDRI
jgi:hypothetical protein